MESNKEKLLQFNKVNYWKRIILSYRMRKEQYPLLIPCLLMLCIMLILRLSMIGFFLFLSFATLAFVLPIVLFECRIYTFEILLSNDKLIIKYLHFNKEKVIKTDFGNIKIVEYGSGYGSKTEPSFKIYQDFGKGNHIYLINQYKIIEWSKPENIKKLKDMLDKSIQKS
jgi:hypothetical protein